MFANSCNLTPPNWNNPKNLQKFSCIWAAYHQQKHPSLNVFKRWESLKSGTRGFQFFFLATNCWKLQIGSSTLWWALGRVDASYLHIKGFWQQQKIRRMQNNMMAWYFGQVLLIKWCLTKSPTFIFYPWNDNRWVLDTVLKTQVLAINVWENIFEPLNAVKTSWHCQLDNRSTFKVILYTRQFFSFLIFLFHSAQWAVLILPNLWYVGLDFGQCNDPRLEL